MSPCILNPDLNRRQALPRLAILAASLLALCPLTGAAATESGQRPWELMLYPYVGYDNNVPLAPEQTTFVGEKGSFFAGTLASGSYRFYQDQDWQWQAGGLFNHKRYSEYDVEEYNLTTVAASINGRRAVQIGAMPSHLHLAYTLRDDYLGGSEYEISNTLQARLTIPLTPKWLLEPGYQLALNNFAFEGNDPAFTSRDATNHRLSVNATHAFSRYHALSFGYAYTNNHAKGSNFEFDAHEIFGRYTAPLTWVLLTLEARYSTEGYIEYTPVPERAQDNLFYRATVIAPLSRHMALDTTLSHARYNGSDARFEAERTQLQVALRYAF